MRVVVDANIVAAALIRPDGWTAGVLERADVTWFVPEAITTELDVHVDELASKARVTPTRLRRRARALIDRFVSVGADALEGWWDHPHVLAVERVDPDDAIYVAAALAVDADLIWTRDKALLDALEGWAVLVLPQRPDGP